MNIAIQGHPTRGKEIIQILRSLGATSYGTYDTCSHPEWYWYINKNKEITCDPKRSMCDYKLYTLEEFERKFPFKIGETVITTLNHVGTIIGIVNNKYEVMFKEDSALIAPRRLKPYKEMKKERNITLTLDKAKEWYKKGGELREIALQAFTEKELTKVELPKTWEEFCINHPRKKGESYTSDGCNIITLSEDDGDRDIEMDKNICPSKESAEAHLAMIQLEQLRDCWRQGWKPTEHNIKHCITHYPEEYSIMSFCFISFLSFPTREMAEEFLECFRDLIEKAGDLI